MIDHKKNIDKRGLRCWENTQQMYYKIGDGIRKRSFIWKYYIDKLKAEKYLEQEGKSQFIGIQKNSKPALEFELNEEIFGTFSRHFHLLDSLKIFITFPRKFLILRSFVDFYKDSKPLRI